MFRAHLLCLLGLLLSAPVLSSPRSQSDSWIQTARLMGSDTVTRDYFGRSLSVSGSTLVVGAYGHDVAGASSRGAAYVFVERPGGWVQEAKLLASDGEAVDAFGRSVSVDGNEAVIGANLDDHQGQDSGSAYLFTRSGSNWTQQTKLIAPDADDHDEFGTSVAILGDRILVGSPKDGSSGSAYVFRRDGSRWIREAKLEAADDPYYARFGYSVCLDGTTAMIGAPFDPHGGPFSGSAYVFVRSGTTWTQQAKLVAPSAEMDDEFGYSVSISDETAVVGNHTYTGEPGAFVFVRSGTSWSLEARLIGADTEETDYFGSSVAILEDRALVGSYFDDTSGSAYVFERMGGDWIQQAKIVGADTAFEDHFGASACLLESRAFLGADGGWGGLGKQAAYVFSTRNAPGTPYCFGNAVDENSCPCGNENDVTVPWGGCRHDDSLGGARLDGEGVASVSADSLVLRGSRGPFTNTTLFFQGTINLDRRGVFLGDGILCAGGELIRLKAKVTNASGEADSSPLVISTRSATLGHQIQPGETLYYQWWIRDSNYSICLTESNASNGYGVTWLP